MDAELELFFPKVGISLEDRIYYSLLRKRTLLVLKNISNPSERLKQQIDQIDNDMLHGMKIKTYHGAKGQEVRVMKGFEETCLVMGKLMQVKTKEMTVLEYFQANETLSKKNG